MADKGSSAPPQPPPQQQQQQASSSSTLPFSSFPPSNASLPILVPPIPPAPPAPRNSNLSTAFSGLADPNFSGESRDYTLPRYGDFPVMPTSSSAVPVVPGNAQQTPQQRPFPQQRPLPPFFPPSYAFPDTSAAAVVPVPAPGPALAPPTSFDSTNPHHRELLDEFRQAQINPTGVDGMRPILAPEQTPSYADSGNLGPVPGDEAPTGSDAGSIPSYRFVPMPASSSLSPTPGGGDQQVSQTQPPQLRPFTAEEQDAAQTLLDMAAQRPTTQPQPQQQQQSTRQQEGQRLAREAERTHLFARGRPAVWQHPITAQQLAETQARQHALLQQAARRHADQQRMRREEPLQQGQEPTETDSDDTVEEPVEHAERQGEAARGRDRRSHGRQSESPQTDGTNETDEGDAGGQAGSEQTGESHGGRDETPPIQMIAPTPRNTPQGPAYTPPAPETRSRASNTSGGSPSTSGANLSTPSPPEDTSDPTPPAAPGADGSPDYQTATNTGSPTSAPAARRPPVSAHPSAASPARGPPTSASMTLILPSTEESQQTSESELRQDIPSNPEEEGTSDSETSMEMRLGFPNNQADLRDPNSESSGEEPEEVLYGLLARRKRSDAPSPDTPESDGEEPDGGFDERPRKMRKDDRDDDRNGAAGNTLGRAQVDGAVDSEEEELSSRSLGGRADQNLDLDHGITAGDFMRRLQNLEASYAAEQAQLERQQQELDHQKQLCETLKREGLASVLPDLDHHGNTNQAENQNGAQVKGARSSGEKKTAENLRRPASYSKIDDERLEAFREPPNEKCKHGQDDDRNSTTGNTLVQGTS